MTYTNLPEKKSERISAFSFPVVEQGDPKVASKVIYNFVSRGGPIDDLNVLLNLFWVDEKGLNRYVDFARRFLSLVSRWLGPLANPNGAAEKSLGYSLTPYNEHLTEANVVLPLREGNDSRVNVGLSDKAFLYQGLTRLGK